MCFWQEIHHPMGKESEPFPWKDEKMSSSFVVFVAEKSLNDTKPEK